MKYNVVYTKQFGHWLSLRVEDFIVHGAANQNNRPVTYGWYEKAKLRKEILGE